jgi:hypothetical protein
MAINKIRYRSLILQVRLGFRLYLMLVERAARRTKEREESRDREGWRVTDGDTQRRQRERGEEERERGEGRERKREEERGRERKREEERGRERKREEQRRRERKREEERGRERKREEERLTWLLGGECS